MDPIGRFERLAVDITRQVRRFYRYLTGDRTCLGFVRLMCVTALVFDVAAVIVYFREGELQQGVTRFAVSVSLLVMFGPYVFRAAASTDRSPIGPGAEAVKPDSVAAIDVACTVILVGVFLADVVYAIFGDLEAGDALATISGLPYVLALWGPQDHDGGKGDRTLSKDLRRLARRAGPEVAGGHITRRPVPVPVDT